MLRKWLEGSQRSSRGRWLFPKEFSLDYRIRDRASSCQVRVAASTLSPKSTRCCLVIRQRIERECLVTRLFSLYAFPQFSPGSARSTAALVPSRAARSRSIPSIHSNHPLLSATASDSDVFRTRSPKLPLRSRFSRETRSGRADGPTRRCANAGCISAVRIYRLRPYAEAITSLRLLTDEFRASEHAFSVLLRSPWPARVSKGNKQRARQVARQ